MCRSISLSKETKPMAERLGDGEQIKAKGEGKGGWQTRKRDGQPGRVRWTGITCKPLFPGEPPMRALSTGQDARRRRGDGRRLRLGVAHQAHGFAPDHFEPSSPDATAWPVLPLHCGKRRWQRRIYGRGRRGRGRGGEWPQHRTHPSRLHRGAAFLTLSRSVA
jgi:hypothetical protein